MMKTMFAKTTHASVQQHYVQAREIVDDCLCLFSASSPTQRVYRAVIEVSTLNFLLKAEVEQDALVARYQTLLKALTFPIQILVRNERLDLHPYLTQIQEHIPMPGEGSAWEEIAASLEELLEDVGRRHALIERRCYLVIPAPEFATTPQGFPLWRKRRWIAQQEEMLVHALQELEVRVEMVQHQLAACGLRTMRLRGVELATLYHRCLLPERALTHPLQPGQLAAVGRVSRLLVQRKK